MMRINSGIAANLDCAKSFFANIKGVAGIEAAFIFPVMLMIYSACSTSQPCFRPIDG